MLNFRVISSGTVTTMNETGIPSKASGGAHWNITDPRIPTTGDYQVLDTDYTSYSLVWSCKEIGPIHTELIFLLGRARTMDKALVNKLLKELDTRKLDRTTLEVTDQTGCK